MNKKRVEVFYRGRVQGVGFRQTTFDLAESRLVTGWVRNLPDGRVQLVAEGEEPELQDFLAAIARRLSRNIEESLVQWGNYSGDFTDFRVT